FYAANELTWAAAADSVAWTDAFTVSSTAIKGTKDNLYKAVVTTAGGKTATIYVYVKDTSKVPDDGFENNGNYKFGITSAGVVNSYKKLYEELPYSEQIIIPTEVDGVKVLTINTNLFNKNYTIYSVYFEEGATRVGNAAFSGASNLVNVYLPNTMETLEEWAFNGTAIKEVNIPDSLVNWTKNTFTYTTTIEKVTVGKKIKTFPSAFTKVPNLKELKMPYTVTTVASGSLKAFEGIEKFYVYNRDAVLDNTQLKAGSSVTIYGATYASDGVSPSTAKALAEANGNNFVAIDDEIKAIEDELKAEIEAENAKIENIAKTEDSGADYIFRYDKADNSSTKHYLGGFNPVDSTLGVAGKYTIPAVGTSYEITYATSPASLTGTKVENAKITKIGSNAFKNNAEKGRVYNLVISEGYVSIGDSAFYGLSNMRYLTLPSTITTLANYAFGDAVNLKSLTIPDSLASIGASAFGNTTSLTEIKIDVDKSSLASIGNNAFTNAAITKIEI
ncbi:MAG: leucine-rich repeat protein, partial [Clostridia bacterium]|nr:leucine-rich repeat protein [Clostridia bacterium]